MGANQIKPAGFNNRARTRACGARVSEMSQDLVACLTSGLLEHAVHSFRIDRLSFRWRFYKRGAVTTPDQQNTCRQSPRCKEVRRDPLPTLNNRQSQDATRHNVRYNRLPRYNRQSNIQQTIARCNEVYRCPAPRCLLIPYTHVSTCCLNVLASPKRVTRLLKIGENPHNLRFI